MRTREYDPADLVEPCREYGGLTTSELAFGTASRINTTWYRCQKLQEESLLTGWRFGSGRNAEVVWYAVE